MFCKNCGRELEADERFCPICGTPVSTANEVKTEEIVNGINEVRMEEITGVRTEGIYNGIYGAGTEALTGINPEVNAVIAGGDQSNARSKKKGGKAKFFVLGGIGVLIIALVVLGFIFLPGFLRRTFSSPEDYFAYVMEQESKDFAKGAADGYEIALSHANFLDTDVTYNASFKMGDDLVSLIENISSRDVSAFSEIEVNGEYKAGNGLIDSNGAFLIKGATLLDYDFLMDISGQKLYLSLPALYDQYMEITFDDLEAMTYSIIHIEIPENFEETVAKVLEAYPDKKVVEDIINRYSKIIFSKIKGVEKTTENLSVGDVTETCTVLKFEFDEYVLEDMVEEVVETILNDKDIENVFNAFSKIDDSNVKDRYREFMDRLKDSKSRIDDISDENDFCYDITLWVGYNDRVKGVRIELDNGEEFGLAMPRSGDKVGIECYYQTKYTDMDLIGEGAMNGDKLNAELTLYENGEDYLQIGIEKLDLEQIKKGLLNGSMQVSLSQRYADELSQQLYYQIGTGIDLEDFVLQMEFESTKDSFEANVRVLNKLSEFLTAHVEVNMKKAADVSTPASGNCDRIRDVNDLIDYLGKMKLDQWAEDLDAKGLGELANGIEEVIEEIVYSYTYLYSIDF